jgi:hypothetical protein
MMAKIVERMQGGIAGKSLEHYVKGTMGEWQALLPQ